MTIHLISFASILHKQVSLRSSHEAILSEIEKYYTSNPQLSSSASFLRLNVLSSLN